MIFEKFIALCFSSLSLLSGIDCQSSKPPGAQVQISLEGLHYAGNVAMSVLEKNLHKHKIDDFAGKERVLLNNVDYWITNIMMDGFTKPTSAVTVNPGVGLTWSVSNGAIALTGDWKYQYRVIFKNIRDSGTFKVSVSESSATVTATLGRLPNGKPTIRMLSCSCTIGKLNVEFFGGASWLYNLFTGFIEEPLKRRLQLEVCKAAERVINVNAANELATLTTKVILEERFAIDYSLTSSPEFNVGYIQTSHRGEVQYNNDISSAPFSGPEISVSAPTRMVTAYLTEYVINTLGYVLFKNNILRYNLTKEHVPDDIKPSLLTSCIVGTVCFGALFPKARELYPDASVELHLITSEAPTLSITSQSITGIIKGKARVGARLLNGELKNVLSLGITFTLGISPAMRGNTIVATVTQVKPTVAIENSEIGTVPADSANDLIGVVSNGFFHPRLNEIGQKGLDLPNVENVQFIGPAISFIEGALVVSTDVKYTV